MKSGEVWETLRALMELKAALSWQLNWFTGCVSGVFLEGPDERCRISVPEDALSPAQ